MNSLFKNLPDVLLQIILDFVSDGPFRLSYNFQNKKFVLIKNPSFILLNKVNEFKIDYPPDFAFYNSGYSIILYLTITFPILFPSKYKYLGYEEYLNYNEYTYYDFQLGRRILNSDYTEDCIIKIPKHYEVIMDTNIRRMKQQMERKNLDEKSKKIFQNRLDGLKIKDVTHYDLGKTVHTIFI
jgi:hypothetical protein